MMPQDSIAPSNMDQLTIWGQIIPAGQSQVPASCWHKPSCKCLLEDFAAIVGIYSGPCSTQTQPSKPCMHCIAFRDRQQSRWA